MGAVTLIRPVLSTTELAKIWGRCPNTILAWLECGLIPAHCHRKRGRRNYFIVADLRMAGLWLEDHSPPALPDWAQGDEPIEPTETQEPQRSN